MGLESLYPDPGEVNPRRHNQPRQDMNEYAVHHLTEDLHRAVLESELLRDLEHELYALAQDSLSDFIRAVWGLVEGERSLEWNWHLDAICEHLEAVARGQILKLAITQPPRTTKTTTVSVAFPPWVWAGRPSHLRGPQVRILTGSHNESLAIRDARASRIIVESEWYQQGFHVALRKDQNLKHNYATTENGFRRAFGSKTGITGEGGDILAMDDPHTAEEGMYSKAEREAVLRTWDQQIANRVNDPRTSARIVTMQRLHVDDLVGHVLKEGGWQHLNLMQEYDRRKTVVTSIGWVDPRSMQGELLWPSRFTSEVIAAEKKRLGAHGYAAQHMQDPQPLGGSIIPVDKFFRYKQLPRIVEKVQFWDTAQKEKELNDPWAGGAWGRGDDNRLYLMDLAHDRMSYPTGKERVIAFYNKHKPSAVVVEDKSSGTAILQECKLLGIPVLAFEPEGDKVMRMSVESPAIEAGMVGIPEDAPWVFDFLTECQGFPDASHDDRVDMMSMALKWFREGSSVQYLAEVGGTTGESYWRRQGV